MTNKRYCRNSHDLNILGLDTNGSCRACKRERDLKYFNKKMINIIERLKKQTRDRIYLQKRRYR
jgi:hypothetical protein